MLTEERTYVAFVLMFYCYRIRVLFKYRLFSTLFMIIGLYPVHIFTHIDFLIMIIDYIMNVTALIQVCSQNDHIKSDFSL